MRIVEMKRDCFHQLAFYLKTYGLSNCIRARFIGFTPLWVYDRRRVHRHRVFKDIAKRGHRSLKSYGFKLPIIPNDSGEINDLMVTKANVEDRKPPRGKCLIAKLYGKSFGDKTYLSITKFGKNMKTKLFTPLQGPYYLRKRAILETIFDQLKNIH